MNSDEKRQKTQSGPVPKIPVYLDVSPETYYYKQLLNRFESIKKYEKYEPLVKKSISDIFSFIDGDIESNSVGWIGGGRAWYENVIGVDGVVKDIDNELSIMEHFAIESSNWDVFTVSNTLESQLDVICKANSIFERLKTTLSQYFIVSIEQKNFKTLKTRGNTKKSCNPTGERWLCTVFDCMSISLHVSPIRKSKRISRINSDSESDNANESDYSKLLLYIECGFIKGLDINLFKDSLLKNVTDEMDISLQYSNFLGLVLFSRYIIKKRTDKGFNVDLYRRQIVNRLSGVRPEDVYLTYLKLFKNTTHFNMYYIENLVLEARDDRVHGGRMMNYIENRLISLFRGYINYAISELNKKLSGFGEMFIVGGDAFRRYLPDKIKETRDIDTKLYYTREHKTKVINILVEFLSRFCIVMNYEKHYIFQGIQTFRVPDTAGNPSLEYVETITSQSNLQFTLRNIKPSTGFPVNLFSVDYSYIIKSMYAEHSHVDSHRTLPILDIVLIEIAVNKDNRIKAVGDSKLYIASPQFLRKDLEHTFSNAEMSGGRYWSAKNEKDKVRYSQLMEYINSSRVTYDHSFDSINENIDNTFYDSALDTITKTYQDILSNHINDKKVNPKVYINNGIVIDKMRDVL